MVIEALTQRRDSIAEEIRQLRCNLQHINAVIKMFQGNTTKPRKQRGETTRAVLNTLRESGKRMTAAEIAGALGTDVQHIRLALTQQRARGTIRRIDEPGKERAWEIVR